jgi:Lanthionine synthetase C-like protein
VADTEERFTSEGDWPPHRQDADDGSPQPLTPLYFGAIGVIWALHHLRDIGAVELTRDYLAHLPRLKADNQRWLAAEGYDSTRAAYLMGDTPLLMMSYARDSSDLAIRDELERLITGNIDHPTRELMWGAPGTMLASWFLYERTRDERWARFFRETARQLQSQLLWSQDYGCRYWTQDMYGRQSTFLDAVHGFVATASVLIRGRELLDAQEWQAWQACISNTVTRTATWRDGQVNWRTWLLVPEGGPRFLMQFCHGAPGFVICLGDLPGTQLDPLLAAAGDTIWAAGPLTKGSNLCHGTAGNGYAFLKLFRRTGHTLWLDRARAFAMHGIAQTEADLQRYGQGRYSLWTGDPGFAIYLWHCLKETALFPTLDVF